MARRSAPLALYRPSVREMRDDEIRGGRPGVEPVGEAGGPDWPVGEPARRGSRRGGSIYGVAKRPLDHAPLQDDGVRSRPVHHKSQRIGPLLGWSRNGNDRQRCASAPQQRDPDAPLPSTTRIAASGRGPWRGSEKRHVAMLVRDGQVAVRFPSSPLHHAIDGRDVTGRE
jgi:hypothetical protein